MTPQGIPERYLMTGCNQGEVDFENSLKHLPHCCFKRIFLRLPNFQFCVTSFLGGGLNHQFFMFTPVKPMGDSILLFFCFLSFVELRPASFFSKQKVQTFFYRTKKSIWDSFFFLKIDTHEANKTFFVDGFKNPAL